MLHWVLGGAVGWRMRLFKLDRRLLGGGTGGLSSQGLAPGDAGDGIAGERPSLLGMRGGGIGGSSPSKEPPRSIDSPADPPDRM